ncbi:MAG: hypothetical protein ACI835_005721 [Planctomycetota bacterium]|jgi:hypothetical protein
MLNALLALALALPQSTPSAAPRVLVDLKPKSLAELSAAELLPDSITREIADSGLQALLRVDGSRPSTDTAKMIVREYGHSHLLVGEISERTEALGIAARVRFDINIALLDLATGKTLVHLDDHVEGRAGSEDRARLKAQEALEVFLEERAPDFAKDFAAWKQPGTVVLIEGFRTEDRGWLVPRMKREFEAFDLEGEVTYDLDAIGGKLRCELPQAVDLMGLDLYLLDVLPELELVATMPELRYRLSAAERSTTFEFRGLSGERARRMALRLEQHAMEVPGVLSNRIERDEANGLIRLELALAGAPFRVEEQLLELLGRGEDGGWTAIHAKEGINFAYRPAGASVRWEFEFTEMSGPDHAELAPRLLAFLGQQGLNVEEGRYDAEQRRWTLTVPYAGAGRELWGTLWQRLPLTEGLERVVVDGTGGTTLGFRILPVVPADYQVELLITGLTGGEASDELADLLQAARDLDGVQQIEVSGESAGVLVRLRHPETPPVFLGLLLDRLRAMDDAPSFLPGRVVPPRLRLHVPETTRLQDLPMGIDEYLPDVSFADSGPAPSIADVVAEVENSVVTISAKSTSGMEWSGSGFVVSPRGHVMTNAHVVDAPDGVHPASIRYTVNFLDGRSFEASVVNSDADLDIALLSIPATGLRWVRFGDNLDLRRGDPLIVIGAPRGLRDSVTTGIVSGFNRQNGWIQSDALINPGNSGGPAFDSHGRVIGISVAGHVQRYQMNGEEVAIASPGLNFFIPIRHAQGILGMVGVNLEPAAPQSR